MATIKLALVNKEYNPDTSGNLAVILDEVVLNTYHRTELPADIAFIEVLLNYAFELGVESATNITDFKIGQRVIYNNVICTVCRPEDPSIEFDPARPHIRNPEKGYVHWVSKNNLKPLPGGQF